MGFFFFILVNATLFLRPSEIFPSLATANIYEMLILSCFACSFMSIAKQLTVAALEFAPITLGVLGIWALSGLSHVMQLEFTMAGDSFHYFFKIVVYYLLLVGTVDTPTRLRIFLLALGCFITVLTLIAVLRFTEVIVMKVPINADKLQKLADKKIDEKDADFDLEDGERPYAMERYFDDRVGEEVIIKRLRGTGIFSDPNDLCLALVFGIILCLYAMQEPSFGFGRFLCVLPIGLFLVALRMTMSRGGLLGLFAGIGVLFACRYGWRRALFIGVFLGPVVLVLFGGRMTELNTAEGTGQSRLQLWRDGLVEFKASPAFGVGMGRYHEFAGLVAHNSFMHAFTELGVAGGVIFLGMFYYAFWALKRYQYAIILDEDMRRLLPFMIAMLAAYATGIFTLSRCYDVPTYTMLGLATVYLRVTPIEPPLDLRCNGSLLKRALLASLVFLFCIEIIVRTMAS